MRPTSRAAISAAISAAFTAFAISATGCGGSAAAPSTSLLQTPAAGSTTVVIRNFSFHQPALTVRVGTTVSWKNADPLPTVHTATADDSGGFNTGAIQPGGTASFRFTTPGEYPYHCAVHSYMAGSVQVVP